MTSTPDPRVAAQIEEMLARKAQRRAQRAELAAARRVGLKQRHAARLRRAKQEAG